MLMALVLVAMALLSLFANYENRQLDQIEKVTIIKFAAAAARPSPDAIA